MKKTLISVAAASLVMGTVASADVNVDLGGQAVIYYETNSNNGDNAPDLFDQAASSANVGLQMDAASDLGNDFGLGYQMSVLGTLGLENNLVNGVIQGRDTTANDPLNSYAHTKLYITKKMANTTIKAGRQELPKSLSPLAFSEGWAVFKNTFDAILAINSDIPDTTLVGAYVSKSNKHTDLADFSDTIVNGPGTFNYGGAYMLTAQNKSVPMTTLTGTYYHISTGSGTGAATNSDLTPVTNALPASIAAYWVDAKVADKDLPLGLNAGVQLGNLEGDWANAKDTSALGVKVGGKVDKFDFSIAYTDVDNGDLTVQNVGTGVKTPLYTQMVANQDEISWDATTVAVGAGANLGDAGKVSIKYGMTTDENDNSASANDYTELDVVYKVKVAEMTLFAAWVHQEWDKKDISNKDANDKVRVWARYNF